MSESEMPLTGLFQMRFWSVIQKCVERFCFTEPEYPIRLFGTSFHFIKGSAQRKQETGLNNK